MIVIKSMGENLFEDAGAEPRPADSAGQLPLRGNEWHTMSAHSDDIFTCKSFFFFFFRQSFYLAYVCLNLILLPQAAEVLGVQACTPTPDFWLNLEAHTCTGRTQLPHLRTKGMNWQLRCCPGQKGPVQVNFLLYQREITSLQRNISNSYGIT